ncbi:SRPBCC family protein [Streptomyces sp. NPDC049813]|uniref:SRPBCC family protein n=1 Tax=Streptomyces sp. NPDC049813 TaxID=3365597 RepID=UPI003799EDD5
MALTGSYLTLDDGRTAVRLTRTYARPRDHVWAYVTDPAQLRHWFPSAFEAGELSPGAPIRFYDDPHAPDTAEATGTVLTADAPRHLSYSWGADELRFDLEPLPDGGTRLTLTDVLERSDTAARTAAGWDVCLSALDAADRGAASDGAHAGSRAPWKELYDAYRAAGFPSGAPVPGLDDLS